MTDLVHGLPVKEWLKRINEYVSIVEQNITVCKDCGAVKLRGKWVYDDLVRILKDNEIYFIEKSINVKEPLRIVDQPQVLEINVHKTKAVFKVSMNIAINERKLTNLVVSIPLKVNLGLCPRCIAQRGKAYKAIIQIRAEDHRKDPKTISKELLKKLPQDIKKEIVEIKETKDGVDLYVYDISIARYIAKYANREYGALIKESYKLISRKPDGHVNSRLTISLRFPSINVGDFVKTKEGNIAIVEGISNGRVKLLDVVSGHRFSVPIKSYWNKELVREENIRSKTMTVIGTKADKIIVMDDEYNVYEAKIIHLDKSVRTGDKVKVLIYKGLAYIVD